jgi:hypothetical protein
MGDLSAATQQLEAARQTDRALKAFAGMLDEYGAEESRRADLIKAMADRPFGPKLRTRGWGAAYALITKGKHLHPQARKVAESAGLIAFHAAEVGRDPRYVRFATMRALEQELEALAAEIKLLQTEAITAPLAGSVGRTKAERAAKHYAHGARLMADLAMHDTWMLRYTAHSRRIDSTPTDAFERIQRLEQVDHEMKVLEAVFKERREMLQVEQWRLELPKDERLRGVLRKVGWGPRRAIARRVQTFGALLACDRNELLAIDGVGSKTVDAIEEALHAQGLKLREMQVAA